MKELSQKIIIVQHDDTKYEKAHVYFITEKPIKKRTRTNNTNNETIPLIEVKSDSSTYIVCPPSTYESGYEYQIIGCRQIQILDEEKCQKLEDALDNIFEKYSSCIYISSPAVFSYLTDELKNMTKTLKIDFVNNKISNGTRNNTLLAVADSLIANHYNLNRLSIIINNNIYKDIMFLINILSHV